MKLIVVTAPTFFVEEEDIITALFEEGLDILHLRKPETSAMYSERLLTLIPEKYHKRIVTHEHFYLQEEFNLMGIHLNQRNPNEPHDYAGNVSTMCHTLDDLTCKKRFYDYVFLTPHEEFTYSADFLTDYTPEQLKRAKKMKQIDSRVMAFGGTLENVKEIKKYGFGGAVIMNDLWHKFNASTDRDYQAIIDHFKKIKAKVG